MIMNLILIFIAFVSIMLAFMLGVVSLCDDNEPIPAIVFALMFLGEVITISFTAEKGLPKAIDVYRGNTTLKITYQDSVAIDSVVVYKNK